MRKKLDRNKLQQRESEQRAQSRIADPSCKRKECPDLSELIARGDIWLGGRNVGGRDVDGRDLGARIETASANSSALLLSLDCASIAPSPKSDFPKNNIPKNTFPKNNSSKSNSSKSNSWPCSGFAVPEIDNALPRGQLSGGAVHELLLSTELDSKKQKLWFPALFIATALTRQAITQAANSSQGLLIKQPYIAFVGANFTGNNSSSSSSQYSLTPFLLQHLLQDISIESLSSSVQPSLEQSSLWSWQQSAIFLNPKDQKERLLSAVKLLNSAVICAIIVDGSGFTLTATRRLQLAAQKHGALCFLLRPPWEEKNLSAAQTRWRVRASANQSLNGKISGDKSRSNESPLNSAPLSYWSLEMFQAKGAPSPMSWEVLWSVYDKTPSFSLVKKQPAESNNTGANSRSTTSTLHNLTSRFG